MTRGIRAGALATCVLLAGCHDRTLEGRTAVYTFAGWAGLLVILAGAAALGLGWGFRRTRVLHSVFFFIAGVLLLLFFAPAMYRDRVIVADDHLELRYGFWFSQTVHHVRFEGLREVEHLTSLPMRRRRRRNELNFTTTDHHVIQVLVGRLAKKAVPEILERLRARGVRVVETVD